MATSLLAIGWAAGPSRFINGYNSVQYCKEIAGRFCQRFVKALAKKNIEALLVERNLNDMKRLHPKCHDQAQIVPVFILIL